MENEKKATKLTGHELLILHLKTLLEEAEAFEYDDFKNTKHPAPKIALVHAFELMAQKTRNGEYDQ